MPLQVPAGQSVLFIRKDAYERSGLTRDAIDRRLNLTPDEFRVEAGLIALGPLAAATDVRDLIGELEGAGLTYFDDFFELSGNWPDWLGLYVVGR